jgi:AcrR family transcriptional regulator
VVRETQRRPLPADRLLDAASDLFDREGIRAVGVDRLISEADVARASLYQNFGSKDALVLAWIARQDVQDRARYDEALRAAAAETGAPVDALTRIRTLFDLAMASTSRRRYRGCLYVNALTEFPDHDHAVHEVVTAHRRWVHAELADAAAMAGAPNPAGLADRIQLLYDGALVGAKTARSTEPIRLAEQLALDLVTAAVRDTGRVESPV